MEERPRTVDTPTGDLHHMLPCSAVGVRPAQVMLGEDLYQLADERQAHLTLVARLEEQRQITRDTTERAVEMERQRNAERVEKRAALAAAEARIREMTEALKDEIGWLSDMGERTQHLVTPASCRERARKLTAALAPPPEAAKRGGG